MNILYATSEAAPFCKTGGLADVAGSLPIALAAEGATVSVVMPYYHTIQQKWGDKLEFVCYDYVTLGWRHTYCGLFRLVQNGVTWYFLDNQQYFNRPTLYGHMDDGERFGFFSRAIVEMLPYMGQWPDVIHCNDWQTALVPVYLEDMGVREDKYKSIRTALSIHNIEYQGKYDAYVLGDLFGLDEGWVNDGTLRMDGCLNLLKGAIMTTDAINAVSPTYAKELMEPYYAHGLDSILQQNAHKMRGILNGIDLVRYNPATDSMMDTNFSMDDMTGKAQCKRALQELMGLPQEPFIPVVGLVSRLVSHKGLDLLCEKLEDMMKLPMQLVILGKGDEKYEAFFTWAQTQYPGRIAVRLDYNEALSSAIYAGSDLYIMPSKSEPCGLSQMIAMRYGTVPVVRETGGLKDSVQPYDGEKQVGNGFTFAGYTGDALMEALNAAVYLYKDFPEEFGALRHRAMVSDFSWNNSAKAYLQIYSEIADKISVKSVALDTEVVVQLETEENPAVEAPMKKPRKKAAPSPKEATRAKKPRASRKKVTDEATSETPTKKPAPRKKKEGAEIQTAATAPKKRTASKKESE